MAVWNGIKSWRKRYVSDYGKKRLDPAVGDYALTRDTKAGQDMSRLPFEVFLDVGDETRV
jgi:hypothetical protein